MRLVKVLLSTSAVYSSGPVTALMQKRPPRSGLKNPSDSQKRAVSARISMPSRKRNSSSPVISA